MIGDRFQASLWQNCRRLVVLPEFDVQNVVPTVYHLNYESNLTLYNMTCEVLTYKRHGCGKALLVICDIEPKL
jgi:hypothetical protein